MRCAHVVHGWEATWKLRVLLTKNGWALLWELESLTATRRNRDFRSKKWNGGSKFSKNLYKCYWNIFREIWNRKSTAILESTVLKNNFFLLLVLTENASNVCFSGSTLPKVWAPNLVEARRKRSRQFRQPALPPRFPAGKAEARRWWGTPGKVEALASASLATTRFGHVWPSLFPISF